jgi:hypothetical protein
VAISYQLSIATSQMLTEMVDNIRCTTCGANVRANCRTMNTATEYAPAQSHAVRWTDYVQFKWEKDGIKLLEVPPFKDNKVIHPELRKPAVADKVEAVFEKAFAAEDKPKTEVIVKAKPGDKASFLREEPDYSVDPMRVKFEREMYSKVLTKSERRVVLLAEARVEEEHKRRIKDLGEMEAQMASADDVAYMGLKIALKVMGQEAFMRRLAELFASNNISFD